MEPTDEEREFRLRPRKPRLGRNERAGWSSEFKLLMHYARSTSKKKIRCVCAGKGRAVRPYQQRCAIRVTYLNSKIHGQWKAHGRYLARESAAHSRDAHVPARAERSAGFGGVRRASRGCRLGARRRS